MPPEQRLDFLKQNIDNTTQEERSILLIIVAEYSTMFSSEFIPIIISKGVNINAQNNNGETALMLAALSTSDMSTEDTVRQLLAAGADPNIKDISGKTALIHASRSCIEPLKSCTLNTLIILLKAGADPNIQDNNEYTALMHILHTIREHTEHNTNVLSTLLEYGADPNVQTSAGSSALTKTWFYSDIELLLRAGANPNLCTRTNGSPLMISTVANKKKSIRLLLKAGADPNLAHKNGNTALLFAINYVVSDKIVDILINNGANPYICDETGQNAFQRCFTTTRTLSSGQIEPAPQYTKYKLLYNHFILPQRTAFNLGWHDPESIVSRLPQEIVRHVLSFL